MSLGKQLENIMISNNLTKTEFADRIGVKRPILNRYFSDETIPSAKVIQKVCEEFNLSADYVIFGYNSFTNTIEEGLLETFRSLSYENQLAVIKEATGLKAIQDIKQKED